MLAILALGCNGVSNASGSFLSPDRLTFEVGQGRDFSVHDEARSIDLVATDSPPEGVHFSTEGGLGTSRVQMRVEAEASTVPGTYRIRIYTYRHDPKSGYERTGGDRLRLTIQSPP